MPPVSNSLSYTNFQILNTKYFESKYFIDIEIFSEKNNFELQICIDTGSGLNLLPRKIFEKSNFNKNDLESSNISIKGISNMPIKADGKLVCTVKFSTGYVKNVIFHVKNCEIPPLLGFDFFNDSSITSFTFKRRKLILNRIFGVKTFKNEIFYSKNEKASVFGENSDKLGNFPIEAPILTKENTSIYIKQHPISAAYKDKVEN